MQRFLVYYKHCLVLLLGVFACGSLSADASSVQLANLSQDVMAIRQEMGRMRLKIESLERQNIQLATRVAEQNNGASSDIAAQGRFEREMLKQNRKQKEEIIALVTTQIDSLAKQTQKGFDAIAKSGNSAQVANFVFSDDYPKTGIAYEVKKGDTLGGIAHAYKSKVKDIRNANRIMNPKSLRAGETIFIPQKEQN